MRPTGRGAAPRVLGCAQGALPSWGTARAPHGLPESGDVARRAGRAMLDTSVTRPPLLPPIIHSRLREKSASVSPPHVWVVFFFTLHLLPQAHIAQNNLSAFGGLLSRCNPVKYGGAKIWGKKQGF